MNLNAIRLLLEESTPDGVDCHSAAPEYGNGSAAEIESALLLYSLVRRLQPRCCVETGTNFGFSTAWIALALQDVWKDYPARAKGFIYTVDATDYPENEVLWNRLGVQEFIHKAVADSRTCRIPEEVDFLFLDSDHSTEHVLDEWRHFAPALNPQKALVLCHDTRLDVRTGPAMEEIVRQLKTSGRQFGYCPFRNLRGSI